MDLGLMQELDIVINYFLIYLMMRFINIGVLDWHKKCIPKTLKTKINLILLIKKFYLNMDGLNFICNKTYMTKSINMHITQNIISKFSIAHRAAIKMHTVNKSSLILTLQLLVIIFIHLTVIKYIYLIHSLNHEFMICRQSIRYTFIRIVREIKLENILDVTSSNKYSILKSKRRYVARICGKCCKLSPGIIFQTVFFNPIETITSRIYTAKNINKFLIIAGT
jgi:hypothetical protein